MRDLNIDDNNFTPIERYMSVKIKLCSNGYYHNSSSKNPLECKNVK
jgi:hypothetical protein